MFSRDECKAVSRHHSYLLFINAVKGSASERDLNLVRRASYAVDDSVLTEENSLLEPCSDKTPILRRSNDVTKWKRKVSFGNLNFLIFPM